MFKKIVPLIFAIVLSGCAAEKSNMSDDQYLRSHLIAGKTTQDDVRKMFGEPNEKTVLSAIKTVVWQYTNDGSGDYQSMALSSLSSMIPGGSLASGTLAKKNKTRILSMRFDEAGVLMNYSASVD